MGWNPCSAFYVQAGREARVKNAAIRRVAEAEAAKVKAAQDPKQANRNWFVNLNDSHGFFQDVHGTLRDPEARLGTSWY